MVLFCCFLVLILILIVGLGFEWFYFWIWARSFKKLTEVYGNILKNIATNRKNYATKKRE
jgi:hypothetical protein